MLIQDVRWKRSRGRGDKFGKPCWGHVTEGLKSQTNDWGFIHKAIFQHKKGQYCVLAVAEWVDPSREVLEIEWNLTRAQN